MFLLIEKFLKEIVCKCIYIILYLQLSFLLFNKNRNGAKIFEIPSIQENVNYLELKS